MDRQSFTNESGHKYAKLGNTTTRTIVVVAALLMCLMYITFIGVSALNSSSRDSTSGATQAPAACPIPIICTTTTTTVTVTSVSTSTVISHSTITTTTTSPVCCETTTATATDYTTTSTLTSTSISAVCCETTTSTTTQSVGTATTTVTMIPDIVSGDDNYSGTQSVPAFTAFTAPSATVNCQVTLSLATSGFTGASQPASLELSWISAPPNAAVSSYNSVPVSTVTGDTEGLTLSLSANQFSWALQVSGTESSYIVWWWTYTAICPSS